MRVNFLNRIFGKVFWGYVTVIAIGCWIISGIVNFLIANPLLLVIVLGLIGWSIYWFVNYIKKQRVEAEAKRFDFDELEVDEFDDELEMDDLEYEPQPIDYNALRADGWHIIDSMKMQFCKKHSDDEFEFRQWDTNSYPMPEKMLKDDWLDEFCWISSVIDVSVYEGCEAYYLQANGCTSWNHFKKLPNAKMKLATFIFNQDIEQF